MKCTPAAEHCMWIWYMVLFTGWAIVVREMGLSTKDAAHACIPISSLRFCTLALYRAFVPPQCSWLSGSHGLAIPAAVMFTMCPCSSRCADALAVHVRCTIGLLCWLTCAAVQVKVVGDLSLTLPDGSEASVTGQCVSLRPCCSAAPANRLLIATIFTRPVYKYDSSCFGVIHLRTSPNNRQDLAMC